MEALNSTSTLSRFAQLAFSWYDYLLFGGMLVVSAVIGIYFGCFGRKQATTKDYLMGGKTMKIFPIAVSLVASHTSGLTLLALPADIYRFGAAYWLGVFSMSIVSIVTVIVYLPVFYNLQITSTYEYLEKRFDNRVRLLASFLYGVSVILYLPIVVYIPALAFSAATGIDVHYISPVVCGVCIFYTTIGGLKAVVWTDTIQFTVTVGSIATVFILGTIQLGGIRNVWNKAVQGERLDIFDFDLDPTKRESFWIILIGLTVHWVGHSTINQSCVQKFLAVASLKDSIKSVLCYGLGMNIMKTACVMIGFVMYAKYSDCDPLTTKQVTRNDQLLPFYVMDVAKNIPGLSGLFIAGIFSAALSTLSATLNCLAGTIYEDFIQKPFNKDKNEAKATFILKSIVVAIGVISTAMVFLVERMGGLLPLSISLGGVTNGPLLGLFTMGLLFPRANAKGAFYGCIISLVSLAGIVFPAKYLESQGIFKYPHKPLSTEQCDWLNSTIISNLTSSHNSSNTQEISFIFKISYYYYTLMGCVMCMVVGLVISYMTNKNEAPVSRELISPVAQFLLPNTSETKAIYQSINGALHTLTINSEKENNRLECKPN